MSEPTMTGWRKREMQAKERMRRKEQMADIRAARAANKAREEARARGVTEPTPEVRTGTAEHESPTVATNYPDQMDRDEMFAYLEAHGVKAGPNSKDDTLRERVRKVRDGE